MAISGPIALYSNVPIHPEYFKPSRFQISAIALGATTIITVIPDVYPSATINLNYVIGQQVRVLIPKGYGCQQINGLSAYVLSLPSSNQVEISINSNQFDAFMPVSLTQLPQIVAIGNVNTGQINLSNKTMLPFIPGSFINISPV